MLEATLRLAFSLGTFGTMAAWESLRPRRRLSEPRSRRWPANLGLAFVNALVVRIIAGATPVAAAAFAAERGAGLLHWASLPAGLAASDGASLRVSFGWIVTILVLDFAVYLQHLVFHAVPLLWRLHRVHHADLGFDATTGVRFHPIEIVLSAGVKSLVVVLVGGPVGAVIAFEILLNASSLFNHGNVAIREDVDRRLRWLVVTPDMHRIHHSSRVVETNSNFGFSFSLWDRVCGTYRPEPALGQQGLEIGLSEYRTPLHLGELLLLPLRGSAGAYPFAGTRPSEMSAPRTIDPRELQERMARPDPPAVLDVRAPAELGGPLGRLDGAVNIPIDELSRHLPDLGDWRGRLLVPV
jgi:sterol desaturase/sphingolipid hydroxylase (fatty acid hydroxylase superfamily)